MRMLCIDVYWRIIEVIDISALCFCWLFSCPIVPGNSVSHMNSGAYQATWSWRDGTHGTTIMSKNCDDFPLIALEIL